MNPEQQRARFTHTQRLEIRLEDLELVVVDGLAKQIVADRAQGQEDLQVFNERLRVYAEREAARLDAADAALAARLDAFTDLTFYQRLRWLVTGR